MARIDRGSAIALFLGILVVAVITGRRKHLIGELVNLRLGFLNANDVCILGRHPIEKTFAGRCPNSIGIETDNAKQNLTPVS